MSNDTKQELATTGPERDAKAAHATEAEAQPIAVLDEPAPPAPKIKSVTLRAACDKWPEVRKTFVSVLTKFFPSERGSTYNLQAFHGPPAGVQLVIAHHLEKRVDLVRDERRMAAALEPFKAQLHSAPTEVVQQANIDPHTRRQVAPQIRRAVGPTEYAKVLAQVFEIKGLEAVCSRDAITQCKKQCVRAEIELAFVIENWEPYRRPLPLDEAEAAKRKAHEEEHPPILKYDDEQGAQILKARLNLASCEILVRQREALLVRLKEVRAGSPWLVSILRDVDRKLQADLAAQLAQDCKSQLKFYKGMLAAGYDTDFAGVSYLSQIAELEKGNK